MRLGLDQGAPREEDVGVLHAGDRHLEDGRHAARGGGCRLAREVAALGLARRTAVE